MDYMNLLPLFLGNIFQVFFHYIFFKTIANCIQTVYTKVFKKCYENELGIFFTTKRGEKDHIIQLFDLIRFKIKAVHIDILFTFFFCNMFIRETRNTFRTLTSYGYECVIPRWLQKRSCILALILNIQKQTEYMCFLIVSMRCIVN